MVPNLVGLIKKNTSPLEIENIPNVFTAVRDQSVVGRDDNTVVPNVGDAFGRRILGEVLVVGVLDVAIKLLAPLLEQIVGHNNQIVPDLVTSLVRDVVEHVDGLAEAHVVGQNATARVANFLRRHPIHRLLLVVVEPNLGCKAHCTRFCV